MRYSQFVRYIDQKICGATIVESVDYRGRRLSRSTEGRVFVDGRETQLNDLEEARLHIDRELFQEKLVKELYEETSTNKIASIIKEHRDVKITDTLIESYLSLASSKTFSVDPIISEIRALHSYDALIENRIDYTLEDGSKVAIEYETQELLNNLLEGNEEIVSFMRQNKKNFVQVIRQIKESTCLS